MEVPFIELDREVGGGQHQPVESSCCTGKAAIVAMSAVAWSGCWTHPRCVIATGGSIVSEPDTYALLLGTAHAVAARGTRGAWRASSLGATCGRWPITPGDGGPALHPAGREHLYRQADIGFHRRAQTGTEPARDQARAEEAIARRPCQDECTSRCSARAASPRTYDTHPDRYAHWRLEVDGALATLAMNVDEDKGIVPGYRLKLNSTIWAWTSSCTTPCSASASASGRRAIVTSADACSRAPTSTARSVVARGRSASQVHQRDAQRHRGFQPARGAGFWPRSTAPSPAAATSWRSPVTRSDGGRSFVHREPASAAWACCPAPAKLTRLIDKRKVRRDLADVFCSTAEGVRADRARQWKLIDHNARPQQFAQAVHERATALAARSDRTGGGSGIALTPLTRRIDDDGYHYTYVDVLIDRAARTATLTVNAAHDAPPHTLDDVHAAGARWWPLAMARELDDAIMRHQRAGRRSVAAEDARRHRYVPQADAPHSMPATGSCVPPWACCADAGAPGGVLAHAVRSHRRGLVLCRYPV